MSWSKSCPCPCCSTTAASGPVAPAAEATAAGAETAVGAGCAESEGAEFVLLNVQEPPSLYEVVVAHDPEVLAQVRGEFRRFGIEADANQGVRVGPALTQRLHEMHGTLLICLL